MKTQMNISTTLLSLPLMVVRHLLDDAKARAAALGATKKEAESFGKALSQRVWAGVELVEARKLRFDPEGGGFFVGASRPRKKGNRVVMEYAVNEGRCECADHRYGSTGDWRCAPGGNCKHLAAVNYVLTLQRGLARLEALTGAPLTMLTPGEPPTFATTLDTSTSQLPDETYEPCYH